MIRIGTGGNIMPPVESLIRAAKRAEEKGYDAIWWPDHLMGWHPETIWTTEDTPVAHVYPNPHIYLDPVAAMAAVGVHTERVRLGTAVTEPIRRHPAMLANEWMTLDHLTRGRVILGIGAGEAENITPYGLDYSRQVAKFEEALHIIRLLWSNPGTPVSFDGQFWPLRNAVIGLSAYRPGRPPPIWTGAHGPKMLAITGRLADGWLPVRMHPDDYASRLATIMAAGEKAGRDMSGFEPGAFAYGVFATDHDEAHRILDQRLPKGFILASNDSEFARHGAEHPLGKGFYGLKEYIPAGFDRDTALKAIDSIPFDVAHDHIAHGTPDDFIETARGLEAVGCRHLMFQNITFLGDASKTAESFHLQDEVMRAFASS